MGHPNADRACQHRISERGEGEPYSKLEIGGRGCNYSNLLGGRGVVHGFWAHGGEGNATDEDVPCDCS